MGRGRRKFKRLKVAASGDKEEQRTQHDKENETVGSSQKDGEVIQGEPGENMNNMGEVECHVNDGRCNVDGTKRRKTHTCGTTKSKAPIDNFSKLSLEILCNILEYLSLKDVMRMEYQCKKWQEAVSMHLKLITEVDMTDGEIHGWMPSRMTDDTFSCFLQRCPMLGVVYGLHPKQLSKRRQRGSNTLSVPGIITALQDCQGLIAVEISDIFLLEGILTYLPHVDIIGCFKNRNCMFPIPHSNRFSLTTNIQLTSLHLTGVILEKLPRMDVLEELYLKWVMMTDPHPFRDFAVPVLKTFVMNNCAGPTNALKYVPLVTALAAARHLSRLELVRVPFLGGLFQHVVEDSWRMSGFRHLQKIQFGACKHALETDLGYLAITCSARLTELCLQPSLTKDSFLSSLLLAQVDFPNFECLKLGFVDDFPPPDKYSSDDLISYGLADITENPASITDVGMKAAGRAFPSVRHLSLYNCPHLHLPASWFNTGHMSWAYLQTLHLKRCHAIRLNDLCVMITYLPALETLHLENMFREPPKGCSRVGLSAGTGLGVSSALVANHGADVNNVPQAPPHHMDLVSDDEDDDDFVVDNVEMEDDLAGEAEAGAGAGQPEGQGAAPHANPAEVVIEDGMFYPVPNCDAPANQEDQASGSSAQSSCQAGSRGSGHSPSREDDPKPSTSKEADSVPCVSDGLKGEKSEVPRKRQEDWSSDNNTSVTKDHRKDMLNSQPQNEKDTSDVECVVREKSEHSYSTDSSQKTGSGKSGCAECSESQSAECPASPQPSTSTYSTGESTSLDTPVCSYKGKGKSLRGKKKGLVKKSSITTSQDTTQSGQVQDQSCQAVSEEIRESTKKAKECSGKQNEKDSSSQQESKSSQTTCTCSCHNKDPCSTNKDHVSKEDQSKDCPGEKGGASEKKSSLASSSQSADSSTPIGSKESPSLSAGPAANTRSASHTRGQSSRSERRSGIKRKVNTKDQATSTSDPVIEEDHLQLLMVGSGSIQTIILDQVGITDLSLQLCPKLHTLTIRQCRVLRNVLVQRAPHLSRVVVTQCRKLRAEDLVDEICSQPAETNRLILLRPMREYKPECMERLLLRSSEIDYHVYLLHDHSRLPLEMLQTRLKVDCWMDVLMSITSGILHTGNPRAKRTKEMEAKYPWGRNIFKLHGHNEDQSVWEVVTDIPWIRTQTLFTPTMLARLSLEYSGDFVLHESEGISRKERFKTALKHYIADMVQNDIAEVRELQQPLFPYCTVVLVNMCDIDASQPIFDQYM